MSASSNPAPLWPTSTDQAQWFAVHTRFKCEKYVQRLLEKRAVTAYVPLQQFTRRYLRKIKIIDKPLISCYVFVKITEAEMIKVLETEHVAGFVKTGRRPVPIPEMEIQILRRITLEKDLEIEVNPRDFQTGDWVEIAAGNLIGLQGRVIHGSGKQQILIDLETIGYALRISLDATLLRKIQRNS
jgi:transcription antitermination factor NusG